MSKLFSAPRALLLTVLAASLVLIGCAQSLTSQGRQLVEQGNYDRAIDLYYQQIAANPTSAELWRELGVAFYEKGDLVKAEDALKQANGMAPDARASLYLGLINEKRDNVDQALEAYRAALGAEPEGETKHLIQARIDFLMRQRVQQDVSRALQNESALQTQQIPTNTIAVSDFDGSLLDPQTAPVASGLADFTAADLAKVKSLTVVDRMKIDVILNELKLSSTGLVDQASAPRVGRLLGSYHLVTGSLLGLGDDKIRLDGAVVNTTDSTSARTQTSEGNLRQLFQIEKAFVFQILDGLGIQPTPEERDAISEVPTESYLAFLAYGRGLQHERSGQWQQAQEAFSEAAAEDPGFSLASGRAQTIAAGLSMGGPNQSVTSFEGALGPALSSPGDGGSGPGLDQRLQTTSAMSGTTLNGQNRGHLIPPPDIGGTAHVTITGDLDAQ
jgi:tetratricopeptide (TPR) repeat protein